MNKVSTKLIILLILSALVPLVVFGIISIWTARQATRKIVAEENLEVAKRAADQIEQYVTNNIRVLQALGQNLTKTDLKDWQKDRMVKNYALEFEAFQAIEVTDLQQHRVATSQFEGGLEHAREDAMKFALSGRIYRSDVYISKSFIPSLTVAIPLRSLGEIQGAILGQLNLVEMWRLVDSIRIGKEGYALVASKEALLVAHGRSSAKEKILRHERLDDLPTVQSALKGEAGMFVYHDEAGVEQIGVSVPVRDLGWALVIEQPTREAYAAATRLTYQLTFLIVFFLALMIMIGMIGGRFYVVAPIRELIQKIRRVGGGKLDEKVNILTRDEFHELGEAFNQMTERLALLQDEIRRNERTAFLGRIAGGLVHDLKHPIQNIQNGSQLMLEKYEDPLVRDLYRTTVKREMENLNRFLDDLMNLSRPIPVKPVWLTLTQFFQEVLDPLRTHPRCRIGAPGEASPPGATGNNILISLEINPVSLRIFADRFGLERVLKNLINNSIEALPNGGEIKIKANEGVSEKSGDRVTHILISDTGGGISADQVKNIFTSYTTTKRKGLGLGLAICKRILDEHLGMIKVMNNSEKGTTLLIEMPLNK